MKKKLTPKMRMSQEILKYDAGSIHNACIAGGFPTNWSYFDKELKTYTLSDMKNLLYELENLLEEDE